MRRPTGRSRSPIRTNFTTSQVPPPACRLKETHHRDNYKIFRPQRRRLFGSYAAPICKLGVCDADLHARAQTPAQKRLRGLILTILWPQRHGFHQQFTALTCSRSKVFFISSTMCFFRGLLSQICRRFSVCFFGFWLSGWSSRLRDWVRIVLVWVHVCSKRGLARADVGSIFGACPNMCSYSL